MRRNFVFSIGEYYHLYSRGVDKRLIFIDDYDRGHFIGLLFICNNSDSFLAKRSHIDYFDRQRLDTIIEVGAYCLMPNHFHILVREKVEGGISLFMRKLLTAYSSYFNKKYQRTGTLFESRFKAKHADTDEYLKYLFAYIHLNPVKLIDATWKEQGIRDRLSAEKFLEGYLYSSYVDYTCEDAPSRTWSKILNREAFPEYFQKGADFKGFIKDWLTFKDFS